MANPEPSEDFESHRSETGSVEDADRPLWLVGAEEGARSEAARGEEDPAAAPVLKRVDGTVVEPERAAPAAEPKDPKPGAWKAAASSVPVIQRKHEEASIDAEFADEASWTRPVPKKDAAAAAALPDPPARAAVAHTAPQATPSSHDDPFVGAAGLPETADGSDADPLAHAAAPPAYSPPKEAWWAVAIDELKTNRIIQIALLIVVVGLVAWTFWPSENPTLPISHIRAHPERFDGRTVEVKGRVGEVFPMGGGYAYYLHQGKDTIVVFTRSRVPISREKIAVLGSVSTGYLDGVARPALFESSGK